jgi:hypothetical protein
MKYRISFTEIVHNDRVIEIEAENSDAALDAFYDIPDKKRIKDSTLIESEVEFSVDNVKRV